MAVQEWTSSLNQNFFKRRRKPHRSFYRSLASIAKRNSSIYFGKNLVSIAKESVIPGLIDNDYTGEITIFMSGKDLQTFCPKTKIARYFLTYFWVPRRKRG